MPLLLCLDFQPVACRAKTNLATNACDEHAAQSRDAQKVHDAMQLVSGHSAQAQSEGRRCDEQATTAPSRKLIPRHMPRRQPHIGKDSCGGVKPSAPAISPCPVASAAEAARAPLGCLPSRHPPPRRGRGIHFRLQSTSSCRPEAPRPAPSATPRAESLSACVDQLGSAWDVSGAGASQRRLAMDRSIAPDGLSGCSQHRRPDSAPVMFRAVCDNLSSCTSPESKKLRILRNTRCNIGNALSVANASSLTCDWAAERKHS